MGETPALQGVAKCDGNNRWSAFSEERSAVGDNSNNPRSSPSRLTSQPPGGGEGGFPALFHSAPWYCYT